MAMLINVGRYMREVPREKWPFMPGLESVPLKVWLSADYLAVLYQQRVDGNRRLTVNRTRRGRSTRPGQGTDWRDGITWDELQRVKNECLGPDVWCVECYPPASEVVDVNNMRHLWVLDEPPSTRFPKEGYFSDDDVDAAIKVFKALTGR